MTKEKEDRLDELLTGQIGRWRDRWLDTLPPVTQPHTFSPGFRRRMKRLLRRAQARPAAPARPIRLRPVLLLAAILAAMVMMLTAGARAFPAVRRFRSGIIDIFSQTYPKYTEFTYHNTSISEEIIPPITVQTPEGYTETEHEEYILSSVYSFAKEDSAFRLEIKKVFPTSQNTMKIDTEDAEVTYITIHGQEAMLVREDGWVILIWAEGNYFLSISGELDVATAIEFADNIRID